MKKPDQSRPTTRIYGLMIAWATFAGVISFASAMAQNNPASPPVLVPASPEILNTVSEKHVARASIALTNSCRAWGANSSNTARSLDELISPAFPWFGRQKDWDLICYQAETGALSSANLSQHFALYAIGKPPQNTGLTTAYYEPELSARRKKQAGFEAPLLGPPGDLVILEEPNGTSGQPVTRFGRRVNGALKPYDTRKKITHAPENILAWLDPSDLYFLQIQGSGRLRFEDGSLVRAAFAAHNDRPYRSIAHYLLREGWIEKRQMSNNAIKAYFRQIGPEKAMALMNANPRYIFFKLESVKNPAEGPKGVQKIPLTPYASIAIDRAHYPLGALFLLRSNAQALKKGDPLHASAEEHSGPWQSLLVAQDQGGAIKGARRADLFVGSGESAGRIARIVKDEAVWWILLPKTVKLPLKPNSNSANSETSSSNLAN